MRATLRRVIGRCTARIAYQCELIAKTSKFMVSAERKSGKAGSRRRVAAELGFEQVHGVEEGLLLGRGELVEDPGDRAGRAVEPFTDQGGPVRGDGDNGAPPVGGVGVPFDEARPVELGEQAADGGQ